MRGRISSASFSGLMDRLNGSPLTVTIWKLKTLTPVLAVLAIRLGRATFAFVDAGFVAVVDRNTSVMSKFSALIRNMVTRGEWIAYNLFTLYFPFVGTL